MIKNIRVDDIVKNNLREFKAILLIMESKYPNPTVGPDQDLPTIYFEAGQHSVLTHLREVLARVEREVAEANVNIIPEGGKK